MYPLAGACCLACCCGEQVDLHCCLGPDLLVLACALMVSCVVPPEAQGDWPLHVVNRMDLVGRVVCQGQLRSRHSVQAGDDVGGIAADHEEEHGVGELRRSAAGGPWPLVAALFQLQV